MKEEKFIPAFDRILVKPIENKTSGAVFIPAGAREKPLKGTIISLGGDIDHSIFTVKEGDVIMYGGNSGFPIKIGNENFLIMRINDVFGKYE